MCNHIYNKNLARKELIATNHIFSYFKRVEKGFTISSFTKSCNSYDYFTMYIRTTSTTTDRVIRTLSGDYYYLITNT